MQAILAIMARLIYSSFHSGKGEYITDDIDISQASAVCKIRSKQGKLLCEAETVINNKTIFVTISKETTLEINKIYTKAVYDVFLIQDDVSHKLIMGDITIIHDISMH